MQEPREYSCYFLMSALDEGKRSALRPGRTLLPGKILPRYPLESRLGGPQIEKKLFTSAGDRTPVVQSVVRHSTDCMRVNIELSGSG
jgi:hypothetical protein